MKKKQKTIATIVAQHVNLHPRPEMVFVVFSTHGSPWRSYLVHSKRYSKAQLGQAIPGEHANR